MKFFSMIVAAQIGAAPVEANTNYELALDAWSKCGMEFGKSLPDGLPDTANIKSDLIKFCAKQEQQFKSALTAFIMIDGDPRGIADPIAESETTKFREHMVYSIVEGSKARFLLRDTATAESWLTCLRSVADKTRKETTELPCATEEKKLSDGNLKRLKSAGITDGAAMQLIKDFTGRMRQAISNRSGSKPLP